MSIAISVSGAAHAAVLEEMVAAYSTDTDLSRRLTAERLLAREGRTRPSFGEVREMAMLISEAEYEVRQAVVNAVAKHFGSDDGEDES